MTDKVDAQDIFNSEDKVAPLGVIATEGATELAKKIDAHLVRWAKAGGDSRETFIIPSECPRFSSGDGKGIIKSTIRGDDLFFLIDVGNYSCKYNMFGVQNSMSPDDHYQDLKRLIEAASGKAHRVNVIMPLLYGSRQHRRNYRESLDCAVSLQELRAMGVANIITFDAHDPRVQNAIPLMGFDNVMPSYQVLKALFRFLPELKHSKNFMIVSPDEGAMSRNMYYASVLEVDLGMFYKRRDYSRVVNGRNPIVAHEYLGTSVEGKDVFIADDIISSGESMLDIAYELKKQDANRIFASATYAIFTNGLEAFDKAYADGVISGVFGTNLTYR
ncbi:MAG: ribose-phosphate pyrophosphokinase, partial [Hydrogenoanaerobacterium sp.]